MAVASWEGVAARWAVFGCAGLVLIACSDDTRPPRLANRSCATWVGTDAGGVQPVEDAGCEPDVTQGTTLDGVLWAFSATNFGQRGAYYGLAEVSFPGIPCGRVTGNFDGREQARDGGVAPTVHIAGLQPSDPGDWLVMRQLEGSYPFVTTLMFLYSAVDLVLTEGMAITPQATLDKAFGDLGVTADPNAGHLVVQLLQPPSMAAASGVSITAGGKAPAGFDGTSWRLGDTTGSDGIALFPNVGVGGNVTILVDPDGAGDEHQALVEPGSVTFITATVSWYSS
jgi:hypothetical protein